MPPPIRMRRRQAVIGGVNFWRADTTGTNQWANIAKGTSGQFSNTVNNIVLDDRSATVVGAWNSVRVFGASTTAVTNYVSSGTTNSFGTNFWSKAQGSGAAWMEFRPNVLIPGNYDVLQWHPSVTNASSGTPFMICDASGTNTVFANQQTNGGNWTLLGRFNFYPGTNGFIRVLDNFADAGNVVMVDGLKLAYNGFIQDNSNVVLDNTNSEVSYSGSWTLGNSAAGRYQDDYRFASTSAGGTATATYVPNLAIPGLYNVYVWHSSGGNRATNAPWLLAYLGGTTNFQVNQQVNGGGWLPLATALPFAPGTNQFLRLSNNAGPSVVIADAVRFSLVTPLVAPAFQAIQQTGPGTIQLTVTSTPGYPVWVDRTLDFTSWQPWTNLPEHQRHEHFYGSGGNQQRCGILSRPAVETNTSTQGNDEKQESAPT